MFEHKKGNPVFVFESNKMTRSFPHRDRTNGKGKKGRGIGSHTDYGLLVMAAQDSVGGTSDIPKTKVTECRLY